MSSTNAVAAKSSDKAPAQAGARTAAPVGSNAAATSQALKLITGSKRKNKSQQTKLRDLAQLKRTRKAERDAADRGSSEFWKSNDQVAEANKQIRATLKQTGMKVDTGILTPAEVQEVEYAVLGLTRDAGAFEDYDPAAPAAPRSTSRKARAGRMLDRAVGGAEVGTSVLDTYAAGSTPIDNQLGNQERILDPDRFKAGLIRDGASEQDASRQHAQANSQGAALNIAGGTDDMLSTISSFVSLVKGIRDPDKALASKVFDASTTGLGAISSILTGSGKFAAVAGSSDGWAVEGAGAYIGHIAKFGTDMMNVIKQIKKMADHANGDKKALDAKEWVGEGLKTAKLMVEIAKDIVGLMRDIDKYVNKTIPGPVRKALFILEIISATFGLIDNGVKIAGWKEAKDHLQQGKLDVARRQAIDLGIPNPTDDQIEHQHQQLKLAAGKDQKAEARMTTLTEVYDDAEKRIAKLDSKSSRSQKQQDELDRLEDRRADTRFEFRRESRTRGALEMQNPRLKDYRALRELHEGMEKRITRAAIHMGTDALKLAGAITNISGVAAPAGTAISGAGSVVETGLPVFRKAKHALRARAARKHAKGKKLDVVLRHMSKTRTTTQKQSRRKEHALHIWKRIGQLDVNSASYGDDFAHVKLLLEGVGIKDWMYFFGIQQPQKAYGMIVSGIVDRGD